MIDGKLQIKDLGRQKIISRQEFLDNYYHREQQILSEPMHAVVDYLTILVVGKPPVLGALTQDDVSNPEAFVSKLLGDDAHSESEVDHIEELLRLGAKASNNLKTTEPLNLKPDERTLYYLISALATNRALLTEARQSSTISLSTSLINRLSLAENSAHTTLAISEEAGLSSTIRLNEALAVQRNTIRVLLDF